MITTCPVSRFGLARAHVVGLLALLSMFVAGTVMAATRGWLGNADANWNNNANWNGGTKPGSTDSIGFLAVGSSGSSLTNDLSVDTILNGIVFSNNAASFTLTGNRITLGGNITLQNNAITSETINFDMILSATRSFSIPSSSTTTLTMGGVISGQSGYGIIKTGGGGFSSLPG